MTPELSVIIPTVSYVDRKAQINSILSSLEDQSASVSLEVIVVDNGLQTQYDAQPTFSFAKVFREPKKGLSYARNAGIEEAKGKIIAFLDDDVIPVQTWTQGIVQAHAFAGALCVGGPVILNDLTIIQPPPWFSDYFLRFIVPPKFPRTAGIIRAPYYIIGANISFKKDFFQQYGTFDVTLGRRGVCLLSGEDMEIMMRIKPEEIFYEPLAAVTTRITPQRLTRQYFIRRIFWQGVSDARILKKHNPFRYYDRSELYFSKAFSGQFLKAIRSNNFFKALCMIIRIATFKIVSLLRLCISQ